MNKKLFSKRNTILFVAFCSAIICIGFQNSSALFGRLVSVGVHFSQTKNRTWQAELDELKNGDYYVSLGRPRGACDLHIDDIIIDSTKQLHSEARSKLFLGAGLIVNRPTISPKVVSIVCEDQVGFKFAETDMPLISEYRIGMLLQFWRALVDSIFGPVFSLMFLFVLLLTGQSLSMNRSNQTRYYGLGIVAFLYAISLSHLPRLILSDAVASLLHVFLRSAYSISFLFFFEERSRRKNTLLKVLLLLTAVGALIVYNVNIALIDSYYKTQYMLFLLTAVKIVIDIFITNKDPKNDLNIFQYLAATFLFVQTWDFIVLIEEYHLSYSAPTYITLMMIAVAILSYRESVSLRLENERTRFQIMRMDELTMLASRVAHDIRSPIALLDFISPRLNSSESETKELLKKAILRIKEITSNLLAESKKNSMEITFEGILVLITNIIKEKKAQHDQVEFAFIRDTLADSHSKFKIKANASDLSRTLSNLVNNSLEAIIEKGKITVSCDFMGSHMRLCIEDNGKGIPPEILPRLMERGVTHGKNDGNGLGLFYARKFVEEIGGSISLKSSIGIGTTIVLTFPVTLN